MNRRQARECAFKLVYEMIVQNDKDPDELISETAEAQDFVPNEYILRSVKGVSEKKDELDVLISENSKGWKLSRISPVSLSIMRLAIFEMLYDDSVPFNVSINEAVELAKRFGGEDSTSFVNGILGKAAREQDKEQ